jgi:hypothetical protein
MIYVAGAFALLMSALSLVGQAQTTMRVRGTISEFDGKVLTVKSREGKDLQFKVGDNLTVTGAKAITLADLKPGALVGATAVRSNDGKLVARAIHTIPPTARLGHLEWDLEPGASMTNANIAKTVKAIKGHELTLEYPGGSQTIWVDDGTPIVTYVPADRSLLKPGSYVLFTAQVAADGSYLVERIQATMGAVKPPQ